MFIFLVYVHKVLHERNFVLNISLGMQTDNIYIWLLAQLYADFYDRKGVSNIFET